MTVTTTDNPARVMSTLDRVIDEPLNLARRIAHAEAISGESPNHAELIWTQSTLERADVTTEAGIVRHLRSREAQLLREIGPRLIPEPARVASELRVRNGFVDELTISSTRFLTHGAAIFATCPIRKMRLFVDSDTDAQYVFSRNTAAMRNLQHLILETGGITTAAARLQAWLGSGSANNLRTLELCRLALPSMDVETIGLFESLAALPAFKALSITAEPIDTYVGGMMPAISANPDLAYRLSRKLEALRIMSAIRNVDMTFFTPAEYPNLRYLSLVGANLNDEGFSYIYNLQLPKLTSLRIECTTIGENALTRAISAGTSNPNPSPISSLHLDGITIVGERFFRERRLRPTIRHLFLQGSAINDTAIGNLSVNASATTLQTLSVCARLSLAAIKKIAASNMVNLRRLIIFSSGLDDVEAAYGVLDEARSAGRLPMLQRAAVIINPTAYRPREQAGALPGAAIIRSGFLPDTAGPQTEEFQRLYEEYDPGYQELDSPDPDRPYQQWYYVSPAHEFF